LQFVEGVVATPRHEEAFKLMPDAFDQVELWTVRGQVAQVQTLGFPPCPLLVEELAPVKGCVIEDDDGKPGRVTALSEGVEIADDLSLRTRTDELTNFKLLVLAE